MRDGWWAAFGLRSQMLCRLGENKSCFCPKYAKSINGKQQESVSYIVWDECCKMRASVVCKGNAPSEQLIAAGTLYRACLMRDSFMASIKTSLETLPMYLISLQGVDWRFVPMW